MSIILNGSGDSGWFYLLPDYNRMTSDFHLFGIILTMALPTGAFIMLMYVLSKIFLSTAFIKKGFWFFSKAFLTSIEMILGFLSLKSIYMIHYIYQLEEVEPALCLWNKTD